MAHDPTARYLRAPRLPRVSPVLALHLRAPNNRSGNGRHAFAILTTAGRLVEVISEGAQDKESVLRARWPWFDHTAAARLGLTVCYFVSLDVAPAEYARWIRQGEALDPELAGVAELRQMATRAARWMAVREALTEVQRVAAEHAGRELRAAHEGRRNLYEDRGATVYHRHPEDGGDLVSDHLRRALNALVGAGMLTRDPVSTDARAFFVRSVGTYRPTDTTPDLY